MATLIGVIAERAGFKVATICDSTKVSDALAHREPDAIVVHTLTPVLQPTHHPDPGALAHRLHTVEIGDVQDPYAPNFDVVANDLRV